MDIPPWARALVWIPKDFKSNDRSVLDLFRAVNPDLSDRKMFVSLVVEALREDPSSTEEWIRYSEDKRTSSGPFILEEDAHDYRVGYYLDGYQDVTTFDDKPTAVADFLYREALSVLKNERI